MSIAVLVPCQARDPVAKHNQVRTKQGLQESGVEGVERVELLFHPNSEKVWEWVQSVRENWIWIHYPDLLLPFSQVASRIEQCSYPAFHPCAGLVRLTQEESEQRDPPTVKGPILGGIFGKASYAVRTELFRALGGLHPELYLDGDEGFEFGRRVRHFFPRVPKFEEPGRWLYRPVSPLEKRAKGESKKKREALALRFQKEPRAYLESIPNFDRKTMTQLVREQALKPTSPHPPPRKPKSLPGKLWALTTYFNPQDYESKRKNFKLFREKLGVPLCVVELAFADRPFTLTGEDADLLIQLRGGDVLWQKEQLLNLGLQQLPSECDKVAWLDADILFENPNWSEETARLLGEYVVVQPFDMSVRLKPGEIGIDTSHLPLGSAEHEVLHGIAYGVAAKGLESLSHYLAHGHSGYAWAARRQVLEKHGFYRANILGNGDLNMAQAMFGGARYLKTDRLSRKAVSHLSRWADRFYRDVEGSVTCVPGTVFHLWHGNKEDRLYHGRLKVLVEHDFDPENDLRPSAEGPLIWSSEKPGLHRWCEEYFALRAEDPV